MSLNWILWLMGLVCLLVALYEERKDSYTTPYWNGLATAFFLSSIIVNLIYH